MRFIFERRGPSGFVSLCLLQTLSELVEVSLDVHLQIMDAMEDFVVVGHLGTVDHGLDFVHTLFDDLFVGCIRLLDGMVGLAFIHEGFDTMHLVFDVRPMQLLEHIFDRFHLLVGLRTEGSTDGGTGRTLGHHGGSRTTSDSRQHLGWKVGCLFFGKGREKEGESVVWISLFVCVGCLNALTSCFKDEL